MNHEFIPTMGFEDECAECCGKREAHGVCPQKYWDELSIREQHERQVDLMMNGAWDSPVYAVWNKKESK